MWKDIRGLEGRYQVSNSGEVRSLDRYIRQRNQAGYYCRKLKGKLMSQSIDNNGYKYVTLRFSGVSKRIRVHRLVVMAFIENKFNKPATNHKDGNKTNNNVSNLEWVTFGENKSHSFKVLGEVHWLKGKKGKLCPYSKKVLQLDKDRKIVAEFDSTRDVHRKLGYSQGNVASVCRGERNIANGYYWEYTNV